MKYFLKSTSSKTSLTYSSAHRVTQSQYLSPVTLILIALNAKMWNQSDPKQWIPTGKTVAAAGAAWQLKPERVTVPGVGTGAARQSRSHRKLYLNSIYAPETCPKVPAACVSPSFCLALTVWVSWCAMFAQRQCGYIASCMPGLADWSGISWRATRGNTQRRRQEAGGRGEEGSPH